MKVLRAISALLVTIGALNWGLVGAKRFDAVDRLFGKSSGLSRIIYALVGIAGIYNLFTVKRQVRA